MKIFTAAFKKHMRKLLSEEEYIKFFRKSLRSFENIVVELKNNYDNSQSVASYKKLIVDPRAVGYSYNVLRAIQEYYESKYIEELEDKVKEHFVACWQDNDCPQAERTFGVHRLGVAV